MKMHQLDPYFPKAMGVFAIALGVETLAFVMLEIDVALWMYGYIATLAIFFGALSFLPNMFKVVVSMKASEMLELKNKVAELEARLNKQSEKTVNRAQELIDKALLEAKGEL